MSDFWAKRLGTQPAVQPAPAPQQPAGLRPWWQPAPVPQQPVQQPAAYLPGQPPAQPQQASVDPNQEYHIGDLLRQDGYTTEKAQSAKDTESCPSCGSGNYIRAGGPNKVKRCFECGYNERFEHSTAGASGIGQQNVADPRPARVQVNNASQVGAPPMGSLIRTA